MTFIKKKVEIEYSDLDIDCFYCKMKDNCYHTYSDCRHYNKALWDKIDKQLNKIRKNIFDEIRRVGNV